MTHAHAVVARSINSAVGGNPMGITSLERDGLLIFQAENLPSDTVSHGFSTRLGGVSPAPYDSLNLGISRDDSDENVLENYRRFCSLLSVDIHRTVLSHQIHKDDVYIVTEKDVGKGLFTPRDYDADALITNVPNIPLVIFSADCGNILLHDPVTRCIGAVHAGWRGVANGILKKTVEEMAKTYGSNPKDIHAAVGPSIEPCCFETDEDVPLAMKNAFGSRADGYITYDGSKYHVDLKGLNRLWLQDAGVTDITVSPLCTGCRQDLFWSHRKVGNCRGSQIAIIALK